jgi:hypothetical protein
LEIDKKLYNDIKEYCKLNGLKVGVFINNLLRKAFNIEKYGNTPFSINNGTVFDDTLYNNKEEKKVEDMKEIAPEVIEEKEIIDLGKEVNLVQIKKSKKRKLN